MDSYDFLVQNDNPGIEYEIAIGYCLSDQDQHNFYKKVISNHSKSLKILEIIRKITTPIQRCSFVNDNGLSHISVESVSQDDLVGPSDLILHYSDNSRLGLSIKYQNTCNLNITGSEFLSSNSIIKLKSLLPVYTEQYIAEMEGFYGHANNWFRKRKSSFITNQYIDLIRDEILKQWATMSSSRKDQIVAKLFHKYSPIHFWILYLTDDAGGIRISIDKFPVKVSSASLITLQKYQTSYILFKNNSLDLGKMQVKFNNGFLEKCKGRSHDIQKDGILMKYGQPLTSWNFSLI